jgi:2-iminobutanoate/2-iminopropanoate deaminase
MSDPIFHMVPDAPPPVAPYSHLVEKDGWLFITGQLATDPVDDSQPLPVGIEAQTHKVMGNLIRVLRGVDAGLGQVVAVRAFLTQLPFS